ncbi:MAG: hypothetical protein IT464_10535 [Planctomycetes bacterium]|nr:hypothetical protein [Planctomycetota bacterium]
MFIGGLLRNVFIFSGIAAGGAMAIWGAARPIEGADEIAVAQNASPIVLNTARPPDRPLIPLAKPISLEKGFGRTELTGIPTRVVPPNALDELNLDRRWDGLPTREPDAEVKTPLPSSELPPPKATDEVSEPTSDDAALQDEYHFNDLPAEARARALEGLKSLKEGTELLKEGDREFRQPGETGMEGRRKIREAAKILRVAKDKLEAALRIVPDNRDLLELVRDAKANLYTCMKHGM